MSSKIKKSTVILYGRILFTALFSIILTMATHAFASFFGFLNPIFIVLFFIAAFFMFSGLIFLKWNAEFYTVEPGILRHRTGIFFVETNEFVLEEIENISYSFGFFGKIFHFGSVTIGFANETFTFHDIPDPEKFVAFLHEYDTNERD